MIKTLLLTFILFFNFDSDKILTWGDSFLQLYLFPETHYKKLLKYPAARN